MNILVIYQSLAHGNTEKIAKVIASNLNAQISKIGEIKSIDLLKFDILGFGSGIFFGNFHSSILELIDKMENFSGKKAFFFSTSGMRNIRIFHNFNKKIRNKLLEKGFEIIGEFSCRGYDNYGLLKIIGGINKGRPNEKDLLKAEKFAQNLKKL
jgi:flavodoxin